MDTLTRAAERFSTAVEARVRCLQGVGSQRDRERAAELWQARAELSAAQAALDETDRVGVLGV